MAYIRIVGVYMIQSKCKPERIYIGSGVNIKSRWNRHKNLLLKNRHHSPTLQRHFNKYGIEDLVYSIIEKIDFVSKEHLLERENHYISVYRYRDDNKPYFNSAYLAGSRLGSKASPETCRKMSEYRKGRKLGPNGGGWKLSEETRHKQSIHQIGSKNHNYGKKASVETRQKMSISRIGMVQSEETKKKRIISNAKTIKKKKILQIINELLKNKVA